MGTLILVRHGKSEWNVKNIFTGWTDVDLAEEGVKEAMQAGKLIKEKELTIDICFTSYLKRAIKTSWTLLETADMLHVNNIKSWKLNERHYGEWQGRNKEEIKKEVGDDGFWKIRRGYETPPPAITVDDKRHPRFEAKYQLLLASQLPVGESLEQTRIRVVSYFFEQIVPEIIRGKTVLVVAHGNSLRSLIGQIAEITPEEMPKIEIHTGVPHVYEFDENLNVTDRYILKELTVH